VDKEGLWYRVLKARYGEEGGRLGEGDRYSFVWWKTLSKVREGVGEGVGNWFEENIRRVVGDERDTLFWYDKWVGDVPLKLKFPRLFELVVVKNCTVADMGRLGWADDGMAWVWRRRLFAWEDETMRECSVLLHNIVLQVNVYDTWRWLLDPVLGYSVRGTYHYFTKIVGTMDRSRVDDVWLKQTPSKVSLLVWHLLRNRLPAKDNLAQQGVLASTDMACSAGRDTTETITHLFLHCTISSDLWSKVQNWLGISLVLSGDMRQHFIQFTKMAGMPRSSHYFFALI